MRSTAVEATTRARLAASRLALERASPARPRTSTTTTSSDSAIPPGAPVARVLVREMRVLALAALAKVAVLQHRRQEVHREVGRRRRRLVVVLLEHVGVAVERAFVVVLLQERCVVVRQPRCDTRSAALVAKGRRGKPCGTHLVALCSPWPPL